MQGAVAACMLEALHSRSNLMLIASEVTMTRFVGKLYNHDYMEVQCR
jgi:hypothetical protein